VAFGPKRWATYEQVCAGVLSRPQRYFPGDQARNYVRNPGENWAEAYAQFQYQGRFPCSSTVLARTRGLRRRAGRTCCSLDEERPSPVARGG
jgi:hypothetical protein